MTTGIRGEFDIVCGKYGCTGRAVPRKQRIETRLTTKESSPPQIKGDTSTPTVS